MANSVLREFYAGKRVLVTGDTGFKGGWLSLWLADLGAEVFGYALPADTTPSLFELAEVGSRVRHLDADVRDLDRLKASCREWKPEIVFHLAAQPLVRRSYESPKETFDVNVGGSVNVLEAIRSSPSVRVALIITSDKCYENREWVWGYRESDPLGGHDPYSASKAAAEIVVSAYRASFFENGGSRVGVATARSGNVIGGGDWAFGRIVPDAVRAFERGERLTVRNPGSVRPWQHVLEPVSGYLALAHRLGHEPGKFAGAWNFGPRHGSATTVGQLADQLVKQFGQLGWNAEGTDAVQPHEAGILLLSCEKSSAQLGWSAVLDMPDTIGMTAQWYRQVIEKRATAAECCSQDIATFVSRAKDRGQWWAS